MGAAGTSRLDAPPRERRDVRRRGRVRDRGRDDPRPHLRGGPAMKVLMTADGLGGVWTYALELADALAVGGVSVTLAVMGDPLQPGQRAQARASKAAAVHERPFRLEWMVEPWDDVDAAGEWLL